MNALQQFTNYSEPPGPPPPPTATPATASLPQQLIEGVGTPTRAALPWLSDPRAFTHHLLLEFAPRGIQEPRGFYYDRATAAFSDEQTRLIEGSTPSAHAGELPYTLREMPYEEAPQDSTLRTLEQAYVLEDRSAIPAFIRRNRLLGLLLEAQEPLSSAFGEPTVKKLTLVEDREGFVTLFCLILIPGGLDEARRALNAFDESWWVGRSHEAAGKLNFDFELI